MTDRAMQPVYLETMDEGEVSLEEGANLMVPTRAANGSWTVEMFACWVYKEECKPVEQPDGSVLWDASGAEVHREPRGSEDGLTALQLITLYASMPHMFPDGLPPGVMAGR